MKAKHVVVLLMALICQGAQAQAPATPPRTAGACPNDDSGLSLSPGFCATVFADVDGHTRHLVVAPNGVVYVNTWASRRYGPAKPPEAGFVVALQDPTGSGKATVTRRFGATPSTGAAGGTGIGIYQGALYAELNDRIVRYKLPADSIVPREPAEVVVSGLPLNGAHPQHSLAIDDQGYIYIDLGSFTNSCQEKDRELRSPGHVPCTELETRAGIWRYEAKKNDQKFSPAERYATGIRNAVGITYNVTEKQIYTMMHGRDQLAENWPALYRPDQGATLPAEEMLRVKQGNDYGWPTCYFDPVQRKLVLAPEFGGDGGKTVGVCASKTPPVAAFPAHWAPNALVFYSGQTFPAKYRNGAFVAFHGSWDRAPYVQQGYNIVFQSVSGGAKTCEIFATGFTNVLDRYAADHRPSGLAIAPDGALFVSDDQRGRIYRIVYRGDTAGKSAKVTPCPAADASPGELPAGSGISTANLPIAPGATAEMTALGERLYHGPSVTCAGCHGVNATGTQVGPDLTDNAWLWGDGSPASIAASIRNGIPKPKQYQAPMPALGGAQITNEEVAAIAAYLWSMSHRSPDATGVTR